MKKQTFDKDLFSFRLIIILWLLMGLLALIGCTKPADAVTVRASAVCWQCIADIPKTPVTICQEDKPVQYSDGRGNVFSVSNCKLK